MYLDEIVVAQKCGKAMGMASVCSAHPFVIKQTLRVSKALGISPLIEATCNQVNQFGGYTGMTPLDFILYVRRLAQEAGFPFEDILMGGDHLGPNVWQNEPADSAMQKAEVLVQQYVQAGFTKIHLDCSMKLADDPAGPLPVEVSAERAARLAKVAEHKHPLFKRGTGGVVGLCYIIGTEVPIPGGAMAYEAGVRVSMVEEVKQTIAVTREAFVREGLAEAWERVIGVVVQPGVEFGDDFVLPYRADAARDLSRFIESQSLVYEAHSTDYQTRDALQDLVRDHFAILKVGPALTFAYREAVFALALMENELIAKEACSNIIQVLDDVMLRHPKYWRHYYPGDERQQAFKRKYSLSDRVRYYWGQPEVQSALSCLMRNLGAGVLPYALLRQFVGETGLTAEQVIEWKINEVLKGYLYACGGGKTRKNNGRIGHLDL